MILIVGFAAMRFFTDPATFAIEAVDAARSGYLGGLGMPIMFSWIVGGLLAAGVAWVMGKISLGLRSDYLAIATLGISEIIIYFLKFEDWLTRGVKNVNGLPRPVPYEINLQNEVWFRQITSTLSVSIVDASSLFVKACYTGIFLAVLLLLYGFQRQRCVRLGDA